jgi:hypothetical protein
MTKTLRHRIRRGVPLRSDEGADGPLGFLYAFPIWFGMIGLIFVLSYWYWAMALNAAGVSNGARAAGLGRDGVAIHTRIVRSGLGGYANDYIGHVNFAGASRAVVGSLDRTMRISPFPAPRQVTVRVASVARVEAFYARPPEPNSWE